MLDIKQPLVGTYFSRGSNIGTATWVEDPGLQRRVCHSGRKCEWPWLTRETWDNRWREGEGKKVSKCHSCPESSWWVMRLLGRTFRNPLKFPLWNLFNVCSLRTVGGGQRAELILTLKILSPKVSLEGRDWQRLFFELLRAVPCGHFSSKTLKKKKKKAGLSQWRLALVLCFWKAIFKNGHFGRVCASRVIFLCTFPWMNIWRLVSWIPLRCHF